MQAVVQCPLNERHHGNISFCVKPDYCNEEIISIWIKNKNQFDIEIQKPPQILSFSDCAENWDDWAYGIAYRQQST